MEKILFWGTGKVAEETFEQCVYLKEYDIVGFVDNDSNKWGKSFKGYKIYRPCTDEFKQIEFDLIVVLTDYYNEIKQQIESELPEYSNKIENKYYCYKNSIINKYKLSDDEEIQEIVRYLKSNPLEVFNYEFVHKYNVDELDVQYDESKGLYYANYLGKRMYFSSKMKTLSDARNYYKSILLEQDVKSPHKYCDNTFGIKEGDIIVDVGAAEGNFSLEYIDIASEIYIIEADEEWIKALEHTFEGYEDKVHIIHAYAGAFDEDGISSKLDTLIEKKVDFIKMDIEGAEWDALRGTKKIINECEHIKLAICAYHSNFDQVLIENFMDINQIKHCTTPGYMWFPYNFRQGYVSTELQRGIIRGVK